MASLRLACVDISHCSLDSVWSKLFGQSAIHAPRRVKCAPRRVKCAPSSSCLNQSPRLRDKMLNSIYGKIQSCLRATATHADVSSALRKLWEMSSLGRDEPFPTKHHGYEGGHGFALLTHWLPICIDGNPRCIKDFTPYTPPFSHSIAMSL